MYLLPCKVHLAYRLHEITWVSRADKHVYTSGDIEAVHEGVAPINQQVEIDEDEIIGYKYDGLELFDEEDEGMGDMFERELRVFRLILLQQRRWVWKQFPWISTVCKPLVELSRYSFIYFLHGPPQFLRNPVNDISSRFFRCKEKPWPNSCHPHPQNCHHPPGY